MDIVSAFSTAYGATKSIMEIGKGLLGAKIDEEVKARFRALLDHIGVFQEAQFNLREQLLQIQQDKINLQAKVNELQAKLDMKSKVQYKKPSYWVVEGGNRDGPFCQKCYDDNDGKLARLQDGENDCWNCTICKTIFHGPNYRWINPDPRGPRSPYSI